MKVQDPEIVNVGPVDCSEVRQPELLTPWNLCWRCQFPRVSQGWRQNRFLRKVRLKKLPAIDLEPVGLGHNANQAVAAKIPLLGNQNQAPKPENSKELFHQ